MPSGTVKFFNEAKGFGFISPVDGGGDIFVHISAVERSGLDGLNEGDEVTYEVEQDRRSGKFAAIDLRVTAAGPPSDRARRPAFGGRGGGFDRGGGGGRDQAPRRSGSDGHDRTPAGSGSGVVKWFNPTKGFGFIQPEEGGPDVFVHVSAVEKAGMRSLNEGQRVSYELQNERGKTAAVNLKAV
jgi:CspA family cold shock protein